MVLAIITLIVSTESALARGSLVDSLVSAADDLDVVDLLVLRDEVAHQVEDAHYGMLRDADHVAVGLLGDGSIVSAAPPGPHGRCRPRRGDKFESGGVLY